MEQNPTKKCPNCQSDISVLAKKCPHCQSDLRTWGGRHPLLTLIFILFLIGFFINIFISAFTGGSTSTPEVKQENPEYWAKIYSQVNIESTLKSPSTADFCWDKKVVNLGENKYQVTSCVDSQNGFGAMIRSNWQITMKYDGTDADGQKSWNVEKIIFDGEVIYQQ